MKNLLEDYMLSWKGMLKILVLLSVFVGLTALIDQMIAGSTTVYTGECTVKAWRETSFWRPDVALILNYAGGKEAICHNGRVITSYLLNPGPLNCRVRSGGAAYCDERPRPSEKK